MDFVKERLGVEVQFGKYAFMVYNVCAKMTIFNKLGFINSGVEIVPIKEFAEEMSTGVSYFEQFVWDLEQRGVSDIDIPVLIFGITDSKPVARSRPARAREEAAQYEVQPGVTGLNGTERLEAPPQANPFDKAERDVKAGKQEEML
jgi:hypothetical protein